MLDVSLSSKAPYKGTIRTTTITSTITLSSSTYIAGTSARVKGTTTITLSSSTYVAGTSTVVEGLFRADTGCLALVRTVVKGTVHAAFARGAFLQKRNVKNEMSVKDDNSIFHQQKCVLK